MQGHAILLGLVAALAVGTGLRHYISVLVNGDTDEALIAGDVPAFGVRVNKSVFFPLSETPVLPLFVDFTMVMTIKDCVEHDFRVVAVRVGLGTETLGVRENPGVFAHEGAVRGIQDDSPAESQEL